MSYPRPRTTSPPEVANTEQSADSVYAWEIWRITQSPRWVRSSRGPDYLIWQGTTVGIIRIGAGFTYDLEDYLANP